MSSQRGNSQTPYYARRFTLTLGVDAEVVIGLSSSRDAYLYLLEGHGTAGDVRAYNDDANSRTRNSRLKLDLTAGNYTIEATTFSPRQVGSFTLTVATDIAAAVPVTVTGLASSYDVTVGEMFSEGFTYGPDTAQVSIKTVVPSGFDLILVDKSGSAGMAGKPKLAGLYKVVLEFVQPGRTDTEEFTVSASCAAGHVQQADRSCADPADLCTAPLGRAGSDTLGTKTGSWDDSCALPEGRRGRSGTFYAKHYTFTLSEAAEVTIDLESDDQDTYLFLLRGHGPDGTLVARDDDGGEGRNSRLADLALSAGDYTITASTFSRMRTGSFSLAALGVIGLQDSRDAMVEPAGFSTSFKYRPRTASLKVLPAAPPGLSLTPADLNGDVGLAGTPTRADTYTATIEFTQGTQTHKRKVTITATCPVGKVPHIDGSGTCTPAAAVPAGCAVTALESRGRGWWGRTQAAVFYSALVPSGLEACTSLSGKSKAVYYTFTVPEGAPTVQTGRVNLAPRTKPPLFRRLSLQDGGAPMVALWKDTGSGNKSLVEVGFVARKATTATSDPSLDIGLPAGSYLIEIAATKTSSQATRTPPAVFYVNAWLPLPETVHKQVQNVGNTASSGAGMTLEGFLDDRGSICYGAHPTCPTDADDPFDPVSPTFPWLPFITDKCSIPEGLVKGIESWLNAMIRQHSSPFTTPKLVDLAPYIRDHAKFGTQTVSFVFACMRHDFNWRNLYRVQWHLDHDGAWNKKVRGQAEERFNLDLKRLCNAKRTDPPVTHRHYVWRVTDDFIDKCREVADAMKFGVSTVPMSKISYGDQDV